MVFQAFLSARRPWVLALLALGVAVGSLEGAFVLLLKHALGDGPAAPGPGALLLAAFALVTLRSGLQLAAARVETATVFGWVGGLRRDLLGLAGDRQFPAYRDPWNGQLAQALRKGMEDLAEGASAGLRCFSAAAQAAVLFPLLLAFSWKPALASLALALPVLWISRLRSASLAATADRWSSSAEGLAREVEAFALGLEGDAGNGRLAETAARLSEAGARHEGRARGWEMSKALFPPVLEWLFFAALAALLASAAGAGDGAAGWAASLLPFGALLLLLYRPMREWARAYPARLPGDRAWRAYRTLYDTLSALPPRRPPRPSGGRLAEAAGLRFGYGAAAPVFSGLDLELDPSALTWIPGPNGSGKSTFLKLLAGIEAPQGGEIRLPRSLLACPRPFAYLPQRAVLEPDYPEWALRFSRERPGDWAALDGILGFGALLAKAGSPGPGTGDAGEGEDASTAARAWGDSLSGGERQRLCLARVFAAPAGCLLLDEPTTWLAAGDRERIMGDLLAWWRRDPGRGAVLVSHEPFLGEFCSRTLRLADGAPRPEGGTPRRAPEESRT